MEPPRVPQSNVSPSRSELSLTDKAALITGASGIAAATARLFHGHGADLCVIDVSRANLAALGDELPRLYALQGDLTSSKTCARLVAEALESLGRIDVLVNVVGISGRRYGDGPVHEATDEGWDTVMTTNARTTFTMCREVLKAMLPRRRGTIVNTASVLAYAPNGEHFATHAYAASKGAIISLTRAMAAYYAPYGIRVNAVAPGLIATPMSQRAQEDEAILAYLERKQPLTGRFGDPEDVAKAILYLASELSSFVTGEVVEVSGGWSLAG
jgi:NAD(P)-dependent dehydrogenase (short-subunit alcohol dehydrogenase family)